jgi:SET domain-containing protein
LKGNGLFAKRPFPTGEAVLVLGGIVIDDRELAKLRPRSSLAVGEGLNLMQADDDPAQYGNHSCDPNCWMADEVTVVARRPISADEEITQDYSLMTVAPEWERSADAAHTFAAASLAAAIGSCQSFSSLPRPLLTLHRPSHRAGRS